jgi:hypothetical protein
LSPFVVVVFSMRSTMTSWEVSGRARVFMMMWEKSRCALLFHCRYPEESGRRS